MVGFARKFILMVLCFGFVVTISSCDTLKNQWQNFTQKESKSSKKKKASTPDTQDDNDSSQKTPKTTLSAKPNNEEPNPQTEVNTQTETATPSDTTTTSPTSGDADLIITQKNQATSQSLKKSDVKSVTPPKFTINAPIDVTKRIGGIPQRLFADDTYVYTDDAQDLSVFTDNLEFVHKISRSFPILKINRVIRDNRTYIFAIEENSVLEIFELANDPTTQKPNLSVAASFDVGGPFSWLDPKTLLVFLPNKIQFLDFSDFNNIKVLRELPIGGVTDKIILKNNLYLSRGEFLDVLSLDTYTLTSSLRVGTDTQFLGATRENEKNYLYLAIQNADHTTSGYQVLQLNDDLSGVIDFGRIEEFADPIFQIKANFELGVFFGTQKPNPALANGDQQAYLYHIKSKRVLRGALGRDMRITSGDFFGEWFYGLQNGHLTQYRLTLANDIIQKFKALIPAQTSDKPSLAQIGASQTVVDEYEFKSGRTIDFETHVKSVFLLDQNHLIYLQDKSAQTQQIVVSDNLASEDFELRELPSVPNQKWSNFLTTSFGLLMTTEMGEAHLLDVNLKNTQSLGISFKNLSSWVVYPQNEGFVLVALSQNPVQYKRFNLKATKKSGWVIELYQMLSPTQIDLVSQIPVENPGTLFAMGYDMFALATQTQIEFYTARETHAPRLLEEETKPYKLSGTLLTTKLSPQKDLIYALLQDATGKKIHVFDFENPDRRFLNIQANDVSKEQFLGSSFAKGGQLFILPTPRGTFFYDHTFVNNQSEADSLKAHWPMPAESIDVANRGTFVCVALNNSGVYCGDLLFY